MICRSCEGGFVRQPRRAIIDNGKEPQRFAQVYEVCHDCGGTMIAHCCEGMIQHDHQNDRR